ncbi:hypothetical protein FHS07_003236 [Microbacterium proteolyticum]|uniref:Uncharacterized protein n=1 Tax=Microbacterium proteolyticum TaxID=1572644 RepID=A0A7W5CKV0_9MICO|nr:hypothetical protein [Microbacterium proteolyticum]
MLTETPRGGVDSRTNVGVSREHPLSMARSSITPGPSQATPADRGHMPLPHRATACTQTGLTNGARTFGSASRRPSPTVMEGARHVTRP